MAGEEIVPAAAIEAPANDVRGILAALDADGLAGLGEAAEACGERIPRSDVRLLAPVTNPEKIICLGLNYHDHAAEVNRDAPRKPIWFAKFANSLIGDGDEIVIPVSDTEDPDFEPRLEVEGFVIEGLGMDYEAELAVVIGREACRVTEDEALDYVAGAMPFNDVSARRLQAESPLWTTGKAPDTFAPCGPALVTMDEVLETAGDLQSLTLKTYVDGKEVQSGSTDNMVFSVAELVSWLSRTMTLVPGDIIATGTPAGVGWINGDYLEPGSTVTVEVEGLGAVTNPVRAAG